MYSRPRFSLLRRLLWPYGGDQVLTRNEGMRMMFTWALFFGLLLSLASLPVALMLMQTVQLEKVLLFFLLSFLAGGLIFGGFALFVVVMSNRAARILHSRNAEKAD